jgi:hypothetical protein
VMVRGSYSGISGHDRHVRAFVRELVAQGVVVALADLPHWAPSKLPVALRDPWFARQARPVRAPAVLHFCMPHQVARVRRRLNVNYTMFEASRVPERWVELNRGHDLVIVPTSSARDAWVDSGLPADRIRICPLGVDGELFRSDARPLPLLDRAGRPVGRYRTRVLNVSELVSRKNLMGLLRVWIEATSARDDAILIVRLSPGGAEDSLRFLRQLQMMEHALGKSRGEAAPILFLDRILSDADMAALFAAATHYLSLSHGEGWDLAACEALACELQLIVPAHSGYLAWLDERRAWLIPARRVPTRIEGDAELAALFEGAEWWQPDAEVAATLIQRAIRSPDERQPSSREWLLASFGWPASTSRLVEILRELHAAHGYAFEPGSSRARAGSPGSAAPRADGPCRPP